MVLTIDQYIANERRRKEEGLSKSVSPEGAEQMILEWENIHNKAIFDAINELLDSYRPYGLKGHPMPWSKSTRTLTF